MTGGILLYAEVTRQGYVHTVFFELANKARELSAKLNNAPVMAILFTKPGMLPDYKEGFTYSGIDKVFVFEDEKFGEYNTETYSNLIINLVKKIQPEIFLIGATNQGRDLAPRISSTLGTGLTADCIELDINEKGLLAATRPTFGGQLMATILCKTKPQMATVRPKVFKPSVDIGYKETEFTYREVKPEDFNNNVQLEKFMQVYENDLNELDSAEIIVAGGKGMKGEEGFKMLKELADLLGGTVGATRGAVDLGYAPHTMQIGQTGKTVTPKLYIACAISGAIQHTVGIMGAEHIICINNDPNAPIFDVSDTGIVGDVFEVVPKLIEMLKNKA